MKKTYKFEVTVIEDDPNSPFWQGVEQYESPTNRWVKDHVIFLLNKGELYDVTVVEVSAPDMK